MVTIDQVIRSKRRTIGLTITKAGALVVRAPYGITNADIHAAVAGHEAWILQAKAKMQVAARPILDYQAGAAFPFLGGVLYLAYWDKSGICQEGDRLFLPALCPARLMPLLEQWLRKEAYPLYTARMALYAARMGLTPPPLRLSGALGRWGSCGKNINLNWRLMMAPLFVIDYIVVHELAHVKHKDHSRRFWETVAEFLPDYTASRAWLKAQGDTLTLDYETTKE